MWTERSSQVSKANPEPVLHAVSTAPPEPPSLLAGTSRPPTSSVAELSFTRQPERSCEHRGPSLSLAGFTPPRGLLPREEPNLHPSAGPTGLRSGLCLPPNAMPCHATRPSQTSLLFLERAKLIAPPWPLPWLFLPAGSTLPLILTRLPPSRPTGLLQTPSVPPSSLLCFLSC